MQRLTITHCTQPLPLLLLEKLLLLLLLLQQLLLLLVELQLLLVLQKAVLGACGWSLLLLLRQHILLLLGLHSLGRRCRLALLWGRCAGVALAVISCRWCTTHWGWRSLRVSP